MELKQEIERLISTNREGVYWDFKERKHENKASLLHDIICLANADYRGDRYLIFGVSDEGTVVGVDKDAGGKKQNDYIDFLRGQNFVEKAHPEVELHSMQIKGKEIEILKILDISSGRPFYLEKEYNCKGKILRPFHIYTRNGDTNTPKNESASLNRVEKMWRQRFGIDLSPLERIKLLLKETPNWFKDIGNVNYMYHKQFPEFRIELGESRPFEDYETFAFFYHNCNSSVGTARFYFHSTVLFEQEYCISDGGRKHLATPSRGGNFCYYLKGDLNYLFSYLLTDGMMDFLSRFLGPPFLLFENSKDLEGYRNYLDSNKERLESIEIDDIPIASRNEKEYLVGLGIHNPPITVELLKRTEVLYKEYKKRNNP